MAWKGVGAPWELIPVDLVFLGKTQGKSSRIASIKCIFARPTKTPFSAHKNLG
jgi:hypothetical protein